jgi:hypothetical protein
MVVTLRERQRRLIYQHPTRQADQRIADAMNTKITETRHQHV